MECKGRVQEKGCMGRMKSRWRVIGGKNSCSSLQKVNSMDLTEGAIKEAAERLTLTQECQQMGSARDSSRRGTAGIGEGAVRSVWNWGRAVSSYVHPLFSGRRYE